MLSPIPPSDDVARVRIAEAADEHDLMRMCKMLHEESGLRDAEDKPFPFCEEMARATIQRAILSNRNDPDAGKSFIGIIGERGKPEGSVYLTIVTSWYSQKPFLIELWNYVAPEYRKSNNAKCLIAFSKAFARAIDLTLVAGVMSTERQPAKERLYERSLGCKPFGSYFVFH